MSNEAHKNEDGDPAASGRPTAATGAGLVLASGRRLEVDRADGDRINVSSPDGTFELAITFTAAGPVLRLSAAGLELHTTGALRLSCESLEIDARGSATIRAGTLVEEVDGVRRSTVGGVSTIDAHSVGIRSRLGDVAVHANDNVRVTGEKILLNG